MGEKNFKSIGKATPEKDLYSEGGRSAEAIYADQKKSAEKLKSKKKEFAQRGTISQILHRKDVEQAQLDFRRKNKMLKKESSDESGEIRGEIILDAYVSYLDQIDYGIRQLKDDYRQAAKYNQPQIKAKLEKLGSDWEAKATEMLENFPPDNATQRWEKMKLAVEKIRQELAKKGLTKYVDGFDDFTERDRTGDRGKFAMPTENVGSTYDSAITIIRHVYDPHSSPYPTRHFRSEKEIIDVLAIVGNELGINGLKTVEDVKRELEQFYNNGRGLSHSSEYKSLTDASTLLSRPLYELRISETKSGESGNMGAERWQISISLALQKDPETATEKDIDV